MSTSDREAELARDPLDRDDVALLDHVRTAYDAVDPVPDGLVERIQFQITLDALHAEVATLTHVDLAGSGARSAGPETVRTVTFTSGSSITMVNISGEPGGTVRVDGWVVPGVGVLVEVLLAEDSEQTSTDQDGRFVFTGLPTGFARFVLHRADADPSRVITPSIQL